MRSRSAALLGPLLVMGCLLSGCSGGESGSEEDRGRDDASRAVPGPLKQALAGRPPPARTPAELARQVVAAERAIADPATTPEVLAAAGHLQQVAYRTLSTRPGWDRPVRRVLPAGLRRVMADNVASRREFRSMFGTSRAALAPDLPPWRIVPAAPPRRLLAYYRLAESRFGVGWSYLAAINFVETSMGRIRGTSVAGAQGPMQFMPSTWDTYGRGDIRSVKDSILAAGRFLRAHGFTRPGGRAGALFRYNNSSAYVRGVSLVARLMERRPRAFYGYYHWKVYYLTRQGSILLPEGYAATRRVPVREWLARHPESRPDDR